VAGGNTGVPLVVLESRYVKVSLARKVVFHQAVGLPLVPLAGAGASVSRDQAGVIRPPAAAKLLLQALPQAALNPGCRVPPPNGSATVVNQARAITFRNGSGRTL